MLHLMHSGISERVNTARKHVPVFVQHIKELHIYTVRMQIWIKCKTVTDVGLQLTVIFIVY